MSKVKILTITTIGMLVCNIVLVVFLILGKPHHPPFGGPKNLVIEKLDFDSEQVKTYEELIEKHQAAISEADAKMRELKHQLFELLSKDKIGLDKDAIKQQIGWQQQEIEEIHFQHFLDIKALCKGEQVEKFKDFTEELGKIFTHQRPKE